MALKRYVADADNTITNAFEGNLKTRGSGSNMGYADALEVFSIYGQLSQSSGQTQELSRILMRFPIADISSDRTAGTLPASGSVSFYLRLHNARHPFTLPQDFTLIVNPVSSAWFEGTGLDMDEYKDLGTSNWLETSTTASWSAVGGDYGTQEYEQRFPQGYEDMEIDISNLVEKWIAGTFSNYGIGVRLTGSQEAYAAAASGSVIANTGGAKQSYYTKKFFARSSEFFYKRPVIEARWDSRTTDNRGNFYYSSSLAPAVDNMNNLYYYNYIRGKLVNIPSIGTGNFRVKFYSGSTGPTGDALSVWTGTAAATYVTASYVSTGIYSCSVAITAAATPLKKIYDVWYTGSTDFFTASFLPSQITTYTSAPTFEKVTNITNLRAAYNTNETARFRLFIRDKNWSPTLYTVATSKIITEVVTSASYSIYRVTDDLEVINYGTGSSKCTYLSTDVTGNYFDLDMSLLEKGYMYGIKLSYYNDSIGSWVEQPGAFKFRVEDKNT